MNVQINRSILDRSCVAKTQQSEVHQDKGHLASEAEDMPATANVKHADTVQSDSDEDRRWSAAQRARAVAGHSQQEAQRVTSWAGELLLQLAQTVHTEEQYKQLC